MNKNNSIKFQSSIFSKTLTFKMESKMLPFQANII